MHKWIIFNGLKALLFVLFFLQTSLAVATSFGAQRDFFAHHARDWDDCFYMNIAGCQPGMIAMTTKKMNQKIKRTSRATGIALYQTIWHLSDDEGETEDVDDGSTDASDPEEDLD